MTRGARKLEAALAAFGFAEHVRGARAVDVGASTGGFTRTLLDAGAREVLAVDVGHGQIDAALRADPRVRVLERVDWKKLPPTIEPGPFDAFTVDVSFVAARNMLRGLAFRLRPGALGLVLVKPQFELPEGAVEPGAAGDAAIRARALARFRDKAAKLGFTVLGSIDSPVPGASGTIELFAHLRFDGWSARPAAGTGDSEHPAPETPAARAPSEPARLRWFAITAPGLEALTEEEVAAIPGVTEVQRIEGGVGFGGTLGSGFALNLRSRTATRLLARVGTFRAEDFASFRRRAAALDWSPFLTPGEAVELHVTAKRCKLFHTGAVGENIEHALRDWSRRGGGAASDALARRDGAAPAQVFARGSSNRWTLSVDASGELLHRRGWRTESVKAPLRETLAAAILRMCEWDGASPLVDPMCGAGTLVIEAAAIALGRAPGLDRSFACERWPSFDAVAGERLRAEARDRARAAAGVAIVGYDRDPAAVRLARRNAERAHVANGVQLHHGDLRAVRAPQGRGLVIVNPPYGRRLGDPAQARATIRELGQLLRERFQGWRVAVLAPDAGWSRELGLTPISSTPLRNGGTRIHLLQMAV